MWSVRGKAMLHPPQITSSVVESRLSQTTQVLGMMRSKSCDRILILGFIADFIHTTFNLFYAESSGDAIA